MGAGDGAFEVERLEDRNTRCGRTPSSEVPLEVQPCSLEDGTCDCSELTASSVLPLLALLPAPSCDATTYGSACRGMPTLPRVPPGS